MYQIWHCHIQLRAVASRVCCLAVLSQSGSLSLVSLFQDFSCFPLIEVVDTAPANYNFLGTRGISVIDPVASESEEEKKDSKQGSEEDTYPNSPSGTPEVQSRKDASVKELERVFRRAMWPSLTLTITVMVVCFQSILMLCCAQYTCNAQIVPLPMFFSHYVFSHTFFRFWIACSIVRVFMLSFFTVH